jgi:hypothetical protein
MEARLPVIEITLFCDRAQIPDSLSHVSGLSATLTKAQGIPDAQCDYGRLIGLNNRYILCGNWHIIGPAQWHSYDVIDLTRLKSGGAGRNRTDV